MEVHHHSNVEKKNFKEYFLEFLMIFLAVTMGFFAENIRESITKHEREEQLMKMMVEDLKSDINKLDSVIVKNNMKLDKLDTLRSLVYSSSDATIPAESIKKMYYLFRLYGFYNYGFIPVQRTLSQFNKNDAFSLLRKQKVSDALVDYSNNDERLMKQNDLFHDFQSKAFEFGEVIFNSRLLEDFKIRDSAGAFLSSTHEFKLLTQDKQILLQYAHKLYIARALLFTYIIQLHQQKVRAENLIALIKKEYNLENE